MCFFKFSWCFCSSLGALIHPYPLLLWRTKIQHLILGGWPDCCMRITRFRKGFRFNLSSPIPPVDGFLAAVLRQQGAYSHNLSSSARHCHGKVTENPVAIRGASAPAFPAWRSPWRSPRSTNSSMSSSRPKGSAAVNTVADGPTWMARHHENHNRKWRRPRPLRNFGFSTGYLYLYLPYPPYVALSLREA